MKIIHKGFAYITRGTQLLVFEHSGIPEAGIQVPAGTIRPGETPAAGALREAQEETGLDFLNEGALLGDYQVDIRPYSKEEIHHRYVYHFTVPENTPDTWTHGEFDPSDHSGSKIFRFFWIDLSDGVPQLVAGHDRLLPALIDRLNALGILK